MRYRYTGPDEGRNLAVPGGFIEFPRMQWVDPYKAADAAFIAPHHVDIAVRGLGEDFQAEGPVKAARTRKRNALATGGIVRSGRLVGGPDGDEAVIPLNKATPETPAEPDEEQS